MMVSMHVGQLGYLATWLANVWDKAWATPSSIWSFQILGVYC